MIEFIKTHPTESALVAYYVFSNAVGALPTPASTSSGFYRWFFDFAHLFAGNISRVVATRYPQIPNAVQPQGGEPNAPPPTP